MWKIILLMVMVVFLTACEEGQTSIQMINTGSGSASNATDGNNYTTAFGIAGGSTKNWSLNRSGMPELSGSFVDLQGSGSGGVVNQSFECSGGANEYFYNATWTDGIVNYTCAADTDTDTDDQLLNEIGNPNASKIFQMGGNTVEWRFTNPVGGMIWNLTGGWSNHVIEIHDDSPVPTGTPGDHLLHMESSRVDVLPLHVIGADDIVAEFNNNITVDGFKVCTASNGLCAGSDTNDTVRVNALYSENLTIWSALNGKGISNFTLTQFQTQNTSLWQTIGQKYDLANFTVQNTSYYLTWWKIADAIIQNTSTWQVLNGKGTSNLTIAQLPNTHTHNASNITLSRSKVCSGTDKVTNISIGGSNEVSVTCGTDQTGGVSGVRLSKFITTHGSTTLTNMAAAEQRLANTEGMIITNLTGYTRFRYGVARKGAAAVATGGSKLFVKYATNITLCVPTGNYTNLSTTNSFINITPVSQAIYSVEEALRTNLGDTCIAFFAQGGDGTADPDIGSAWIEFYT